KDIVYHVHGKVTGGAKNVYVTLQLHFLTKPLLNFNPTTLQNQHSTLVEETIKVCTDPSCTNKVEHVRTKVPDGIEASDEYYETYEFWANNIDLPGQSYQLIFGREEYNRQVVPMAFYKIVREGSISGDDKGEITTKEDQVVNVKMEKSE
uniref:Uncharacterized protein n=1 Tax=Romanomermis culicivorax TaxID=13658 RepID=A0A915JLG5_ROMCU